MISYIVHFEVKQGYIEEFLKLSSFKRLETIKEEGNVEFEIYKNNEIESHYIYIEKWKNRNAIRKHKGTQHYEIWAANVSKLLSRDRWKEII